MFCQAGEIHVVVVRMVPYTPWGLDPRVDEELVVGLRVVLSEPARWEGAGFVFHAAADVGWDSVSGFVGLGDLEVVRCGLGSGGGCGGLLLGFRVGRWWVGGLHFWKFLWLFLFCVSVVFRFRV